LDDDDEDGILEGDEEDEYGEEDPSYHDGTPRALSRRRRRFLGGGYIPVRARRVPQQDEGLSMLYSTVLVGPQGGFLP